MMFGSSFWGWLADNYGRKFVSILNTVKPLLYSHSWGQDNRPFTRNRGGHFNGGSPRKNVGRDLVFSLSNVHVSTNKWKWRKSRTVMVIIWSINKSPRNNYVYRCDVSVNPTLACMLYKQTKTLQHFVLWLFLIKLTAESVFLQYCTLSFFYLHLAKNMQLQISLAV